MSVRPSQAVVDLAIQPVVALPPLEPPAHLPVPVPAPKPPAGARSLFKTADRLTSHLDDDFRGRGSHPAKSVPELALNSMPIWGTAYTFGMGAALATATTWDNPGPFFVGVIGGAISCLPIAGGIEWLEKKLRTRPVGVDKAKPLLAAFKVGDSLTQAAISRVAAEAVNRMSAHGIAGEELKSQLRELAAVTVPLGATDAARVKALHELIQELPRRHHTSVSCRSIRTKLEALPVEDRAEVAPLVLRALYRGEQLRRKGDSAEARLLYAALATTQPSTITSREELQKLVAPVGVEAPTATNT